MNKYKKMYNELLEQLNFEIEYYDKIADEAHKTFEDNLKSDNEYVRTELARCNFDLMIRWKNKADVLKELLNRHNEHIEYL